MRILELKETRGKETLTTGLNYNEAMKIWPLFKDDPQRDAGFRRYGNTYYLQALPIPAETIKEQKYNFRILEHPGNRIPLTGIDTTNQLTRYEAERIWQFFKNDKSRDAGFIRTKKGFILYGLPAPDLIMTDGGGSNTEYKQKLKSLMN